VTKQKELGPLIQELGKLVNGKNEIIRQEKEKRMKVERELALLKYELKLKEENPVGEEKCIGSGHNIDDEGFTRDGQNTSNEEFIQGRQNVGDEELISGGEDMGHQEFIPGRQNMGDEKFTLCEKSVSVGKPSSFFSNTFNQVEIFKLASLVLVFPIVVFMINRK